jgi:hypothetical protein
MLLRSSAKSLKMGNSHAMDVLKLGPLTCIWPCVGRVPTRSAPTSLWGGRGPLIGRNGSFPPASEREARMDDPMIRSRLRPNQGTRPLGLSNPSEGPFFFSVTLSHPLRVLRLNHARKYLSVTRLIARLTDRSERNSLMRSTRLIFNALYVSAGVQPLCP